MMTATAGRSARRAMVDIGGFQTLLRVALRKDTTLLGVLQLYRQEVRPFSDKQIALLQNFAAQAVIAMENARLITETREALEQQTATAEVLQVINASPGDLAPVFDAMLERAMRLCEAAFGILRTYDGEQFSRRNQRRPGAFDGISAAQSADIRPGYLSRSLRQGETIGPCRGSRGGRGLSSRRPASACIVELGGARTSLWSRCARMKIYLARSRCTANESGRSPKADRAARKFRGAGGDRDGERAVASPRRARHWNSRPRPPRYCRSSIPRPATSRRCSMRFSKKR